MVSAISADKSHKHQGKLLKSGHEEHKGDIQPLTKEESDLKLHTGDSDQVLPVKPAGRQNRKNHHGKTKKSPKPDSHTGRSRKSQSKTNKHNGQRTHNKHGRKHGRGKQAQ